MCIRHVYRRCRASDPPLLAALLSLLLAGSFARVSFGQELDWVRRAGGAQEESGNRVAVDGAGNSYVTGIFTGVAIFGAGETNQTILTAGDVDVFVARYDNAGVLVWVRRIETGHYEGADITVDAAGNSYVAGSFGSRTTFGAGEANQTVLTPAGSVDIFIAKYDSAGALVWAKRAGGSDHDGGYGVTVDASGNSYVTGLLAYSDFGGGRPATFGPGEANQTILTGSGMFVAKYNNAGALVWASRAEGSFGDSIAVDAVGNSYVTGNFEGRATFGPGEVNQTILNSGDNVVFVAKYDSAGALMWAKQAGTYALGLCIAADASGNSYVTGGFRGVAIFGAGAHQTILTSGGNGDGDMFVAKYDTAGELAWAKRAGGTLDDSGFGIAVDHAGSSYVTGRFGDMAVFGAGESNQTILTGAGTNEIYVAKFNSAGALLWARRTGTGILVSSIAIDGFGNSYLTGSYVGNAVFAPAEANPTFLTSNGGGDVFVARLGGTESPLTAAVDFDGDGGTDILWRDTAGSVAMWLMNGFTIRGGSVIANVSPAWTPVGKADFNGDKEADILWRHSNGSVAIWLMNGLSVHDNAFLMNVGTDWKPSSVGDFNGDGKADILWRHATGDMAMWLMDGTTILSNTFIANVSAEWSPFAVGDLNGDRETDILWRDTSGNVAVWFMNGNTVLRNTFLTRVETDWKPAGTGDFDGDGKVDILWRRTTGDLALWLMNGTQVQNILIANVHTTWKVIQVGDFSGDGKADILWRSITGDLAMWLMDGPTTLSSAVITNPAPQWTAQ